MEVSEQEDHQVEAERMLTRTASRPETEFHKEDKIAVNTPIFLLIREQAKSVVAIQELQARMSVLEGIQERLMLAIQNVHHLVDTSESKANSSPANTLTDPWTLKDSDQRLVDKSFSKQSSLVNVDSPETLTAEAIHIAKDKVRSERVSTSSKGDSYDKDSGLDSDYREQRSEASLPPCASRRSSQSSQNEDELLQLLDMIDQKSLLLLQQVEDIEKKKSGVQDMDEVAKRSDSISLDNLLVENLEAQRQLSEVTADRDDLRDRLSKLELATNAVLSEKMKLQKKLERMLFENQQLQTKIQEFGGNTEKDSEFKNNDVIHKNSGAESMLERGNIKRKYLQYNEKSRRKVSAVLKESNIIELQRQLLMYMMENDVLHAKLEHDHPTRLFHWLKVEARLKQELKRALNDKKELLQQLEKSNIETRNLQETVKYLEESLLDTQREKSVKNFGLGSTDDWRDLTHMKHGNSNMSQAYSPLGYGDFSKTQSLPAMMHLDTSETTQVLQRNEYLHHFDSESFTDVSLDRSSTSNTLTNSCQSHSFCKDLVDLNDTSHNDSSNGMSNTNSWNHPNNSADNTATPSSCCHIHGQNFTGQRWSYSSLNLPKSESEVKFVNGQTRWRQEPTNDLESICTEFDPLSGNASCENFVDSLNLSIPLKPTRVISQLSSIGDSLHSASLDLGCASSAIWHKPHTLSSARSVDGIRQYFIDNSIRSYYKERTFPRFGQGTTIAGSNTPLPVNVMNCLHESVDYTIL